MIKDAISLSELLSDVRATIKESFDELYWVVAEISDIRENQKGHCYITLVEKQDEKVIAQSKANLWLYDYRRLTQKFAQATGETLKVGMKIMILCSLDFHEVYGFGLTIKDIDPTYTMGEMALKKKETIERLHREGLLGLNKTIPLAVVPQRIAIISSPTAAGYEDFMNQLLQNPYGYVFYTRLFPALMQGDEAGESIIKAFKEIENQIDDFDMVVLIRGGGSSIDLSCFDGYDLAVTIAKFQIPVITGIGHERDISVADMVAHTSMKTPTAVAEFILSGVRGFEESILEVYHRIKVVSQRIVLDSKTELNDLMHRFIFGAKNFSIRALGGLKITTNKLISSVSSLLNSHISAVDKLQESIRLLNPENILKRGYSITKLKGQALRDANQVKQGDVIETILYKGRINSIVKIEQKEVKNKDEGCRRPYLFEGIE
ncbi:MAG: exodeoxyribonuclease VII large subunit [Thermodesulfovibrionales bacterium]|nr:exodeoxyribonuclease VII large subunit [Thermodesulfovibrionales bacterium]